ncbi:ribosome-associated protein [Bacilli bacterium PM5-3]|nr:ribosome-associated protein [Bacilli bacterium PM5-3]MDH6603947.1 ribosome-associated protein [Bacilli bacterium PM5-9]
MEKKVKVIANLLDDKHAKDIEIFEVGASHPLFDTVIVASVDVQRNLDAIINEIKKEEKDGKFEVKQYDINNKEWVLIDFYDILVHVFVKETREYYDIDSILEEYVRRND